MTVKLVSTFQAPTAVVFSVKCRLTTDDLEYLVTATINSLSVYSIQDHGLELESTVEISGSVIDLQTIPIPDSNVSNLLVMLDHPEPELLFFSYSESALVLDKQLSLQDRGPRPAEFLNAAFVHPSGTIAVISCYTCRLRIIVLENAKFQYDFDLTLPQANLLSLAFLPTEDDEFVLAILHIDHHERTQLLAMEINVEEVELTASTLLQPTAISSKMVPCPANQIPKMLPVNKDLGGEDAFRGGILILGGRKIILYELTSSESQRKQKGKTKRLEARKSSTDQTIVNSAMAKEKERETRKKKARATIEWPWSQVAACTPVPGSQKFLIGDTFGRFAMLSIAALQDYGLVLLPLGETSPSTTISYLTNGVVFLGSFSGNSQIVKIQRIASSMPSTLLIPSTIKTVPVGSSKGKERADHDDMDVDTEPVNGSILQPQGSFLEILETYTNIAPINDAILVESRADNQRQIVTCSGGPGSGSLNIIRTGADFERLGQIPELANIIDAWPLKAQSDDPHHSHLLASTVSGTHLLRIDSAGMLVGEEPSTEGFLFDSPTLCVKNVTPHSARTKSYPPSPYIVQVTRKGARLLEYNEGLREFMLQASWDVPSTGSAKEVSAASINNGQVFLGLKSGQLVGLALQDSGFKEIPGANLTLSGDEVSAITCIPLKPSQPTADVVAVALWRSSEIRIYSLKDRMKLVCMSPKLPAPARSLLFHSFTSNGKKDIHPHLICGLVNGCVASSVWDSQGEELSDLKIISLGALPVCLTPYKVNGKNGVFAAGSRATLISWDNRHLSFSPVFTRDTLGATVLNTTAFHSSLLLSKPTEVLIGQINDANRLHIRQVALGRDRPMRILHDPSLHVFGVACIRPEPERVGIAPITIGSFRLVDDSSFTHLGQYNCDGNEEIVSLLYHKLPRGTSLYCVGTFLHVANEVEPSEGRLIIFTADRFNRNKLIELSATPVRGCVYSLVRVSESDMIAAACNASVMLFRVNHSDNSNSDIAVQKVGEWCHNYMVTQIAAINNHLVVGDAMHSVSLIRVSEEGAMKTLARDFVPLWPIAVEAIDEQSVIGANDALNLFSFTLQTDAGRAILKRDGFYHYGDVVSKIVRGSLAASVNGSTRQTHIVFTSSGRISLVFQVTDKELGKTLVDLHRNMGIVPSISKGFGGVTHARYRAPRNTRGRSDADEASYGFLDGDLLQKFLTCEDEDSVLDGSEPLTERINAPGAQIRKILETIQDMQ